MPKQGPTRGFLGRMLEKLESWVEGLEFILSFTAIALVVANELVPHTWIVPWLNIPWGQLQVGVRTGTWTVFVLSFVAYLLASRKPFTYIRQHVLELIVCITWVPYYSGAMLEHFHSLTSLEALTVVGTIAHAWMAARWTVRRFSDHPLIVIACAVTVLIGSASALLTQFEPQTFPNLAEAAWFCVVTIFTVGYGDIVPKTPAGRLIATGLIINGVALTGVFIGFISKIVQQRLLDKAHQDEKDQLAEQLKENNELLRTVVEEQRTANELQKQLLAELRKREQPDAKNPTEPKTE